MTPITSNHVIVKKYYKIWGVARQLNVAPSAIRFYLPILKLQVKRRGHVRYFTTQDIEVLSKAFKLRQAGLTIPGMVKALKKGVENLFEDLERICMKI